MSVSGRGANTAIARELGKATSADMPTERVEARGIEQVEVRERGVKPGGTRVMIRKNRKSLKLSLRGIVEIQAQHWPDRLHKPRIESVTPDRCANRCATRGRISA